MARGLTAAAMLYALCAPAARAQDCRPICAFEPLRAHGYLVRLHAPGKTWNCEQTELEIVNADGSWHAVLPRYGGLDEHLGVQIEGSHVYWAVRYWPDSRGPELRAILRLKLGGKLELGGEQVEVVRAVSAERFMDFAVSRDERFMVVQRAPAVLALVALSTGSERPIDWFIPPDRLGLPPSVRLLGWSSDSRQLWFLLDERWFFRTHGASASLVREIAPGRAEAFNPDRGLALHRYSGHLGGDLLFLSNVFSGKTVLVSHADGGPLRWNRRDAFSYASSASLRHVASAWALLRWDAVELWLWAIYCGGGAVLGCWWRRRRGFIVAGLCALIGIGVLGRQVLELSDAMLGPQALRREPIDGIVLHNQLAAGLLFALLAVAVARSVPPRG